MTVLDYGSDSKFFVKYKIIGSGTKCKYILSYLASGLDSRFLFEMKCSFPEKRKGLTEWKVKSVDYVQDFS
jgi:hypothetical protein